MLHRVHLGECPWARESRVCGTVPVAVATSAVAAALVAALTGGCAKSPALWGAKPEGEEMSPSGFFGDV